MFYGILANERKTVMRDVSVAMITAITGIRKSVVIAEKPISIWGISDVCDRDDMMVTQKVIIMPKTVPISAPCQDIIMAWRWN
tara:strand:+ start:267 stop:515 length:249 start_codon:yes stop_codon:yes gene_type:complete